MLKELKNAVSRGIILVAEAVIKPLIVRKNTGRHATKNVATFRLFPLYNAESNKKFFYQERPHF